MHRYTASKIEHVLDTLSQGWENFSILFIYTIE